MDSIAAHGVWPLINAKCAIDRTTLVRAHDRDLCGAAIAGSRTLVEERDRAPRAARRAPV
jgi:hypothetical protein